jgi:hypothetical protein
VIIVEAVKSQNPVTLAYAGVVVSLVYADMIVASECAGDVLEVAPSSLEPPNPGEGTLAPRLSEIPFVGNLFPLALFYTCVYLDC